MSAKHMMPVAWVILTGAILWLLVLVAVAGYGYSRGFPFIPLFLSTLLFGPIGPPLVLLAVTVAPAPETREGP